MEQECRACGGSGVSTYWKGERCGRCDGTGRALICDVQCPHFRERDPITGDHCLCVHPEVAPGVELVAWPSVSQNAPEHWCPLRIGPKPELRPCELCGLLFDVMETNRRREVDLRVNANRGYNKPPEPIRSMQKCFVCNHFTSAYERAEVFVALSQGTSFYGRPDRVAKAEPHMYSVGQAPRPGSPRSILGYCGAKFMIKLAGGEVVTTENLWHVGRIPDRIAPHFLITAEFVT